MKGPSSFVALTVNRLASLRRGQSFVVYASRNRVADITSIYSMSTGKIIRTHKQGDGVLVVRHS